MVGHVSACPNHQTARVCSFATRGEIAQMCNYGYELDIGRLSEEERRQIAAQTAHHRALELLLRDGEFYRLSSPFSGNVCAWELVSADQSRAYVMAGWQMPVANPTAQYLRLQGLDPEARYRVEQLGLTLSGATLMNAGLPLQMPFEAYPVVAFDLVRAEN